MLPPSLNPFAYATSLGKPEIQRVKIGFKTMPRRNSPDQIKDLDDLSDLGELVIDKRRDQRANAKKSRRNRHYEKQFIKNTITRVVKNVPPE